MKLTKKAKYFPAYKTGKDFIMTFKIQRGVHKDTGIVTKNEAVIKEG
jgi:hypothetical protein